MEPEDCAFPLLNITENKENSFYSTIVSEFITDDLNWEDIYPIETGINNYLMFIIYAWPMKVLYKSPSSHILISRSC